MATYYGSLTGSLNQLLETNTGLPGSLLAVAAGTPLVTRMTVIDNGGRSYASMAEWYAANGYDDEEDFLEQTGYATLPAFFNAHGFANSTTFLAAQAYPTVSEVLEACGVTFDS